MGSTRVVNTMLSVFDLELEETSSSRRATCARVIFEYDRRTGVRSFRVLSPSIPAGIASKITAWLQKNVDPEEMELGLEPGKLVEAPEIWISG